ncbi:SRPBCC family protein [Brevibacterium zhoupengii]|uniref:SRPBCC family protein n=1 Tax=Brevibacterium zhoupengii TaxID=2898795 RepID=UPI001E577281|nr:SRPBCC family protein [Brevibacterium zhoupengii]
MTKDHQFAPHDHVRPQAGESAPFHFENRWRVNASVRDVWSVLCDIEAWPQWWPGLPVAVPIDDTIAPGSRADIQVNSPIGMTLSFSIELHDAEAPNFVTFSAAGDLRGSGAWSLQQTGPITTISSVWCVNTRRRSIRLLRPVASSMHSRVMRAGHRGLASRLNRLAS